MTERPLRFEHLARRFGPQYDKRFYGSPLEPWTEERVDQPAHRSWFVGGRGGEVGGLFHAGALHLAVGRGGVGWAVDGENAVRLAFAPYAPEVLQNEPAALRANIHTVLFSRREPLADLRYCRIEPEPGQRFVLSSGLSVDDACLSVGRTGAELADEIVARQPSPARGLFARLVGSDRRDPEGALLIIDCRPDESPPEGFLSWLAFHRERGIGFSWMGNEGGAESITHVEAAPTGDVVHALLKILENRPDVRESLTEDVWEEWRAYGETEPGFERLVDDAPERGFWRRAGLEELECDLNGRASEYLDMGTGDARLLYERHVPGAMLVECMRRALIEPTVVALHQVPSDESVVVWFAIGGISKSSGQLEVLLVERVWS